MGFLFLKLQKAENTGAVCNCSPPGLLSLFKGSHTGRAENEEEHRLFQKKRMCWKMSTQILLHLSGIWETQSKCYAKTSAGNAALAFDQESGKMVLSKQWPGGIIASYY